MTYKPAHIHLGDFGGDWGVCIGVPAKRGQTQNTTVGTAKKMTSGMTRELFPKPRVIPGCSGTRKKEEKKKGWRGQQDDTLSD